MHQFQLTKFSFSSKNTLFKAVFPWNISQMITKTVPISTRITISCAVKRCIHFWLWKKKKENGENSMIKISQRRKIHYIFANRPASRGTHTILLNIPRYARIEEMSRFFKNPLKFSRVIPYFQFLEDFNYRVFIYIVFCLYSASNELFNLRALYMYCSTQICFKFILHSSRWSTARNENVWQDMIDCGEKIFQSDLPMSFIFNHVKKLFLVDKWVEVKTE